MIQRNIEGQSVKEYPTFLVNIGSSKEKGEIEYHPNAPPLEYHKKNSNGSWLISLSSAFTASGENNYTRDIVIKI